MAAHLLNPPAAQPKQQPKREPKQEPKQQAERQAKHPAKQQVKPPTAPYDDPLADVCTTIARRDLDLLDSLLTRLEELSAAERNPDRLATLYGLDHLATRLRRNAETLRTLADGEPSAEPTTEATPLLDTIRAALSSIEQYPRVTIGRVAALAVSGSAADDVSRMLAELLDNAAIQSPPSSTVVVSAHLTEQGSVLVRVEDEGVGPSDAELATLNKRLQAGEGGLGFAVVRRLAARHGIDVRLSRRAPHGVTASALLPTELLRESPPGPVGPVVRTTAGGLPRRIPRRPRTPELSVVESIPDRGEFMADLVAFAEGERDALNATTGETETTGETAPEGDDVVGE